MEAGEQLARPSGTQTAGSLDHLDNRRPREHIDTTYRDIPSMATAALVSPSGIYHSHHSSFSGYPHSAPPTGIPSMISPADSRRASDDTEGPHRQSLPSISEVISGTKGGSFAPPPQPGLPSNQGLPSPFSTSAPPRPFGDVGSDQNPSPRTLHPSAAYPRADTLPTFSDPSRPALSNRPAPPPLNTFPGRHPTPPLKQEHEMDQRHAEYSAGHQHTPSHPSSGLYTPGSRPPHGQLPLPPFPASPRNHPHPLPSPFDAQRPPGFGDERHHSLGHRDDDEYRSTLDKAFESWGYNDGLTTIATSSRAVTHFAEAYMAAAREQQGSPPIPSRLPTENEVNAMISTSLHVLQKLEEVRDIVQQSRLSIERARERENSGGHRPREEDDMVMGGDPSRQPYPQAMGGDVKKRRGRAAPPGRCHSCNRVDTPEWRRGPDGARTLCNACGLHYAKLERKRQMDQRSVRPKTAEDPRI